MRAITQRGFFTSTMAGILAMFLAPTVSYAVTLSGVTINGVGVSTGVISSSTLGCGGATTTCFGLAPPSLGGGWFVQALTPSQFSTPYLIVADNSGTTFDQAHLVNLLAFNFGAAPPLLTIEYTIAYDTAINSSPYDVSVRAGGIWGSFVGTTAGNIVTYTAYGGFDLTPGDTETFIGTVTETEGGALTQSAFDADNQTGSVPPSFPDFPCDQNSAEFVIDCLPSIKNTITFDLNGPGYIGLVSGASTRSCDAGETCAGGIETANAGDKTSEETFAGTFVFPVPEPSSLLLLGSGLAGLGLFGWRRRSAENR